MLSKYKCKNCGNLFQPERTSRQFCSKKCYAKWRKGKPRCEFWYENGYKILSCGDGIGIKEHIKIMEDFIGRKIDRHKENVHHKNGIRDDNRIENLELMTRGEHSKLHRQKEIKQGKFLFVST